MSFVNSSLRCNVVFTIKNLRFSTVSRRNKTAVRLINCWTYGVVGCQLSFYKNVRRQKQDTVSRYFTYTYIFCLVVLLIMMIFYT